jgi:hypothetical protein
LDLGRVQEALGLVAPWPAHVLSRALLVVGYGLVGLGVALYIRLAVRLFGGYPGDWRRILDEVQQWAVRERRWRLVAFALVVTGSGLLMLSVVLSEAARL